MELLELLELRKMVVERMKGAVAGAVVEPWRCKEMFYVSVFPGKLCCDHRRLSC